MADSEDRASFGIDILLENIGEKYEQIKVRRRLLFGRLKNEGSKLDPGQKRKLRRLWRKMNKEYKRLVRHKDGDEGFTERQMETIKRPWTLYLIALIEIYAEISKGEDIRDGDADDTIHGMDWEKGNGDNEKGNRYTLDQVLTFLENEHSKCVELENSIKVHGYILSQNDQFDLDKTKIQAEHEKANFLKKYNSQTDHKFSKDELEDAARWNSRYLALLEFTLEQYKANASHEHTGQQMKTSLPSLLNQLKAENNRAR